MTFKRKLCKHCKGKLAEGEYIHQDCIEPYAEEEAAKAQRKAEKQSKARAKVERVETAKRKQAIKTIPDLIKEAQKAFNAYIRERDRDKPCICCGLPLGAGEVGGAYDCGHYRSTGSASHLRFNEDNAHAQRKFCNRWGAGRAVDYRLGLVARIGLEAVEALESDNTPRKWQRQEMIDICAEYKQKLKDLQKKHK